MKLLFSIIFGVAGLLFAQPPLPRPVPEPAAAQHAVPQKKAVPITLQQSYDDLEAINAYTIAAANFNAAQTALNAAGDEVKRVRARIGKECGGDFDVRPDPTAPSKQIRVCVIILPPAASIKK